MTPEEKKLIEDNIKLTGELRKNFEDFQKGLVLKADYEEKDKRISADILAVSKRLDMVETKMATPAFGAADGKAVDPRKAEFKAKFFNFLRGMIDADTIKADPVQVERKALVSDMTGQILIPEELESEIYREIPKLNVIRKYAFIRTIQRDRIRRRSLTEVTMAWGKLELGKVPQETDVVPGQTWQYVEDLNGLAKIGKDELADSDVAIESVLGDSFSRARAESEETAFMVGLGHSSEQPEGILKDTNVQRVTTAAADAIACDDVLDLIYAVPPQYRRNGVLFVPSTTELAMRKLKSAVELVYLWQPSVQAGRPATFAGYPIENQEDIPAIGTSSQCDIALFGDLRAGYRVLDRQGMTVQRLVELYATAGLVGILVGSRVGGGVIRPNAIRVLREHV